MVCSALYQNTQNTKNMQNTPPLINNRGSLWVSMCTAPHSARQPDTIFDMPKIQPIVKYHRMFSQ